MPISDLENESEAGNDSDDEGEAQRMPPATRRSNSKGFLGRLRRTTSRLDSDHDNNQRVRASHESERVPGTSQGSRSTPGPGRETLQDLSDDEEQQEPRKSRSSWRPSLSLIRQASTASGTPHYLQNDPGRVIDTPGEDNDNGEHQRRRIKGGKNSKKRRRQAKKRRAEQRAALQRQQQLYEQQLMEQAWLLPNLTQVLEKKTQYPLSYDDFEAFLQSQRAVEYLNFWTDVTAHEQLCRTFDVSERRQKREHQLEERAIARDKRRVALLTALESGRLTPDRDMLASEDIRIGVGTGIGIGASAEAIEGSNIHVGSRSSLQLPMNDHLLSPTESRRYGIHDSSAAFSPPSSSYLNGHDVGYYTLGSYNRGLIHGGDRRTSVEMTRPSLEESHISEQDAAVAAVAMRALRPSLYPYNHSREDVRRGSFDYYRPIPNGGLSSMRYQQNSGSNGYFGSLPNPRVSSPSSPNIYSTRLRGRGSIDVIARTNSRSSRRRPTGPDGYFDSGIRKTPSQNFAELPSTPQVWIQDEDRQERLDLDTMSIQDDREEPPHGNLERKSSHQSLGLSEPYLSRQSSMHRLGVGPLQAPVSIHRTGDGPYASSIFSTGQESKGILTQSFRAISLQDLEESAMRIYQKYLIQLRTAAMAAEEASRATKDPTFGDGSYHHHGNDKATALGWDGYAEQIIAEWNAKWQEQKSRRLSTRKRNSVQVENSGPGEATGAVNNDAPLSIDTKAANNALAGSGEDLAGKASNPTSPLSARMKKRNGTGLSALLSPLLTRFLLAETTVVELPTLTINMTTIEETVALDSVEEEEDDDGYDDDDDDYDSDDTEENDRNVADNSLIEEKSKAKSSVSTHGDQDKVMIPQQLIPNTREDTTIVLERSMPLTPAVAPATPTYQDYGTNGLNLEPINTAFADGTVAASAIDKLSCSHRAQSPSSSVSSSWIRVTEGDLEKQATTLPLPITTSKRPSSYRQHDSSYQGQPKAGDVASSPSNAARGGGWKLPALFSKSIRGTGSVPPDLNTLPQPDQSSFRVQIPAIVTKNDATGEKDGNILSMPVSGTNSVIDLQGGPSPNVNAVSVVMDEHEITPVVGQGSSFLRPGPFLSPTVSSITHPTAASSSTSSPAPSSRTPPSLSSPAMVAASAAAAAFYLPLECRQRIHTQIRQRGRAFTPHLFGQAKGFVTGVVLQDHYYPQFLRWTEQHNLGLLTRHHPKNLAKRQGMIWMGVLVWLLVIGAQLTLILLGIGGWRSPWVWVVGVLGGWTGSICLATGVKEFSPVLGLMGKVCEDKHFFRFRRILEPSIRIRHRLRAYWMLIYCIFWSTLIMVLFAALPQRTIHH